MSDSKQWNAKLWMWLNLVLGALGFILFVVFGIRVIIAVAGDKGVAVWLWNSFLCGWHLLTAAIWLVTGFLWRKKLKSE